MSLKSILVHVKAYQDWSESIDVAIRLAKAHGARLTGLYTIRELAMLKHVLGSDHPAAREAASRDAPLMAKAEARFREACTSAGVDAAWDTGEGNAHELLSYAGRCHDLIVVEQSPSGLDNLGTDLVEECAIVAGTPTLIVPRAGRYESIGRHPVVAWNHSRQSAAALHAALPLVARAQKVTLLVGQARDALTSVTRKPDADVGRYARLYNERVDVVAFSATEAEAGERLMEAVESAGGDLLVMGAYGRSTWRQFLFGGATRHVVTHMRLPVLMAH